MIGTHAAKYPDTVQIYEVGPRDGLQSEHSVSTQAKVALINALSQTGLSHIEVGAFVSDKWTPQMADTEQVFQQIEKRQNVSYSTLIPNLKGIKQAIDSGVEEVAVFTAASEQFCRCNINCSIQESLERFEPVVTLAHKHRIKVRGYVSCVIDCPYQGATSPIEVTHLTQALLDLGCYQVSLGDTIGTGTPNKIYRLLNDILRHLPPDRIALHCHDTWGQALANIHQALAMGVFQFDSSVAGLGGCPYARGASGNVATEDVVFLCQGLGITTGVDLHALARAGQDICSELGKVSPSKTHQAILTQEVTSR